MLCIMCVTNVIWKYARPHAMHLCLFMRTHQTLSSNVQLFVFYIQYHWVQLCDREVKKQLVVCQKLKLCLIPSFASCTSNNIRYNMNCILHVTMFKYSFTDDLHGLRDNLHVYNKPCHTALPVGLKHIPIHSLRRLSIQHYFFFFIRKLRNELSFGFCWHSVKPRMMLNTNFLYR